MLTSQQLNTWKALNALSYKKNYKAHEFARKKEKGVSPRISEI